MKFIVKTVLIFLSVISVAALQQVSAQSWAWGAGNAGPGIDAWAITTDGAGNVFGGGHTLGSGVIDFGGGVTVPSSANIRAVWAKYSTSGAPLWAMDAENGSSHLFNLATDPAGNLIVFGSFSTDSTSIGPFMLHNIYGSGASQFFLAKINPAGTVLWAISDGNTLTGYFSFILSALVGSTGGVTTDGAGNIYITSSFVKPTMSIGATTLTNSSGTGTNDIFVAKYSPAGVPLWAKSVGGIKDDYGFGITVASTGNVYITGCYYSASVAVGPSTITNATTAPYAYIAKFDGAAGTPLWAEGEGGTYGAFGVGIAKDGVGNVYMTGGFADNTITMGGSTITQTYPVSGSKLALYLVQYSSSGTVTWSKTIGSPTHALWGFCIALASCGQVWVSGNYSEAATIDTDTLALVAGDDPVFITGYDLSGGVVGYSGLGSGGDDQNGIAADAGGNIYICSDYQGAITVGPDALPSLGSEHFYIGKYTNSTAPPDTSYTHQDTTIGCGGVITETLTAPAGYSTNYWDDGSTLPTRVITAAGTYWVYDVTCGVPVLIDTFHVTLTVPDTTLTRHDTTVCASVGSVILTAPAGFTSYSWSTGSTAPVISVSASGIYISSASGSCSLSVDTFHVNFLPVPVVNLGNDTAFCVGNTLVLSSAQPPGYTYLWSDGTTGTAILVSATGTYWLQVTGTDLCPTTDSIHVTVSSTVLVDLGPDTLNCTASPITLQSSFTYTAPNYLWSDGSITPSIVASVTGTYWLQVTDAGCAGADTVNVTIIYDTFSLANHDTAICFGQEVPVFLNVNPAATCQWLPTAGIAISTIPSPAIGPDTSAEYRVTISLAGCPDIMDSFYIDVQPNPSVFAGGNKIVCQYDTLHFNSFVNPAWYTHYSYSWSPSTFLDDPTMPTVVFTAGTNTEYILTVTTPAGCHSNDSVYVTVHPGDFAKLDTTFGICPHDSVQLIPSGGVSYVWHPALYLSDSTSSAPWSHAITSLAYTAIATSSFGCLDTVYTNVVIHPSAVIYLGDSVTLYPGESYQISPQTNCVNFTWFPAAGLNNDHVSDPVATPLISTKYIVNASTEWGCKTEDSISIYFDQSSLLAIPNAFTPGAGINNKLFIIRRGEATLNYYRIYNRWGNLVFETSDIDEGWDGAYKGKPQPFDVYVYEIEAETSIGSVFKKHGNVTLIR